MQVLAVETTGAFASVALVKDGELMGHITGHDRFSHLQELMVQVKAVLEEGGAKLGDIDVIAASRGPGSFTGIRIGVSSARALSQILGVPCVAVPTLEALAMRAEDAGEGVIVCPMLDARRSQIYAGGYRIEEGFPVEVIKGAPYTVSEFMEKASCYDDIILLGDGADRYKETIEELRPEGTAAADEGKRYQDAVSVAMLGEKIYRAGGGEGYLELRPDYMRLAEAERKLREKRAKDVHHG